MSKKSEYQRQQLLHAQGHAIDAGSFIELYDDASPTDMAIYHLSESVRLLAASFSEELDVEEYIDEKMADCTKITYEAKRSEVAGESAVVVKVEQHMVG